MQRAIKNPKLYQLLSEKQMSGFLKQFGTDLSIESLVEIKDKEADLFGDFIIIGGYKLKLANGRYQCLETPTEQHKPWRPNIIKCKTDSLNYR